MLPQQISANKRQHEHVTERPISAAPREETIVTRMVQGTGELSQWDSYLASCGEDATLFFRHQWQQVLQAYGLKALRVIAYREGRPAGVLTLVEQRSPLSGHQLVSLPWFDAAGVLAGDEPVRQALVQQALELARGCGNCVVQLRQNDNLNLSPHVRTDKVLMRLKLAADPELLWKGFDPRVRNQVRKGEKSGISVELGDRALLPEFFSVYSHNMRDLGSPSHSYRFFDAVCRTFAREATIAVARKDGRAVGAGLMLANGSCLEIPWASSLKDFNKFCVNHAMYWKVVRSACQNGFDWFHFGRSTVDSGTYHFKKQWGAEERQLYWYCLAGDDRRAARAAHSPGEKAGLAVKVWRRLPLLISRNLGPLLISQIP